MQRGRLQVQDASGGGGGGGGLKLGFPLANQGSTAK